jgi:hypothetical protein
MFIHSNPYLFVILILFSKEFIIFNEEILVLSAFVFFTRFIVMGVGKMTANELVARSNKIKINFLFYKNLQTKALFYLTKNNKKQTKLSLLLKKSLTLLNFEIFVILKFFPQTFDNKMLVIGFTCLNRSISVSNTNKQRLIRVLQHSLMV